MMQSVDIAIVGGGMVGLAFAAAMKDSDLRIALIESHIPDSELQELSDVRVSALSRSSESILRNLGAWQGIIDRRAAAYSAMEVWEQDSFARIEFDAKKIAQPDSPLLFDLSKDIGEQNDIASSHPELVSKLTREMKAFSRK